MGTMRYGMVQGAKDYMVSGHPITRLEALVLFGVSNLPEMVAEMRRQGWVVKSRPISYAAVCNRINRYAALQPPANLPVREIMLTEYWINT